MAYPLLGKEQLRLTLLLTCVRRDKQGREGSPPFVPATRNDEDKENKKDLRERNGGGWKDVVK